MMPHVGAFTLPSNQGSDVSGDMNAQLGDRHFGGNHAGGYCSTAHGDTSCTLSECSRACHAVASCNGFAKTVSEEQCCSACFFKGTGWTATADSTNANFMFIVPFGTGVQVPAQYWFVTTSYSNGPGTNVGGGAFDPSGTIAVGGWYRPGYCGTYSAAPCNPGAYCGQGALYYAQCAPCPAGTYEDGQQSYSAMLGRPRRDCMSCPANLALGRTGVGWNVCG